MSEELIEGQNSVEAKLAEAGADQVRRHSFDEAPEVVEAAPETGTPARDEQGRFSSEEPESTEGEVALDSQPEVVEADPDIQKFLAKYGGNVDKALEGAVNLQKQAGQQSNELGDLRRLVDELGTLNQGIQSAQQQAANQPAPIDQGTVDWFDQQMYGTQEEANRAIEWARNSNNPMLFQRGLDLWKQNDPYSASVYTNEIRNQQLRAELSQQVQQHNQMAPDATLNLSLQNVLARNPEFTSFNDTLGETMQKHPYAANLLEAAAASNDPAQIEGAIETLYGLARGDTLYAALRSGATPDDSTTTADVAVPSTSETREAPPAPSGTDRFREAFREEAERQTRGVWVAQ